MSFCCVIEIENKLLQNFRSFSLHMRNMEVESYQTYQQKSPQNKARSCDFFGVASAFLVPTTSPCWSCPGPCCPPVGLGSVLLPLHHSFIVICGKWWQAVSAYPHYLGHSWLCRRLPTAAQSSHSAPPWLQLLLNLFQLSSHSWRYFCCFPSSSCHFLLFF